MNIAELLDKYNKKGITLWEKEGNLKYRAPEGVMDKESITELKKYKAEIIEFLKAQNNIIHDEENRYEIFPQTSMQSAYMIGKNLDYELGGVGCHSYVEFKMNTIMDKDKLEAAWHKLIQNNDMLKAVMTTDGNQKVLKSFQLPKLKTIDFREVPKDKRNDIFCEIRDIMENAQYGVGQWPLHEFALSIYEDYSILHFSVDMLIADYVSVNIMVSELLNIYYGADCDKSSLSATYRDIIMHNRNKLLSSKEKLSEDKEYWLERIEDLPDQPSLPICDTINNDKVSFKRYKFNIRKELWLKICKSAREYEITPSSAVLAVFSEVIRRWSYSKEYCMNITLMKRDFSIPDMDKIIGDFTSVNVLEILNKKELFIERARDIQDRLIEDLKHDLFSGVDVLRELGKKKGKNIVIPVIYTSTIGMEVEKKTQSTYLKNSEMIYGVSQTPQVWIDCQVFENDEMLQVNWDVRNGVFKEEIISSMFDAFRNTLEKLGEDEGLWNEKSIVSISDKTLDVRKKVNSTEKNFEYKMLYSGFLEWLQKTPKSIALISDNQEYSYEELAKFVSAIYMILKESGCKKGDFVAVAQNKGVWQIASVLAILLAQAVYIPIDANQPVKRQEKIIHDSGVKIVLIDADDNTFDNKDFNIINLKGKEPINDFSFLHESGEVLDLAYVIYTSGSTGNPKGVMISHKAAQNTIYDINEKFNVTSKDKVIGISNLSFDLSVYDIFGTFNAGGTLVLPNKGKNRDPKHWIELIEKYGISIWNTVPAFFEMILKQANYEDNKILDSMKLILLSGDVIDRKIPAESKKVFKNAQLISLGGATEAAIWSIYYPITDYSKDESIPYGLPLANQKFFILDKNMEFCPDGVPGDIYIAGLGLADGYLGDEKLTQEKFVYYNMLQEKIYKTGDVGEYQEDGVIRFLGRDDTQVKVNGHRIELGEIENVIQQYPSVNKCAALVKETSKNGKALLAYVELKNDKKKGIISEEYSKEIEERCNESGMEALKDVNRDDFVTWRKLSDLTALVDMISVFRSVGLFEDSKKNYTFSEILEALNINKEYNHTIVRWLNALYEEKYLNKIGDGYRITQKALELKPRQEYWDEFEQIENKVDYGKRLFEYQKESSDKLLSLLRGDTRALDLFFPKGETDVAMAAYDENIINHSLNKVISSVALSIVDKLSSEKSSTIRILEVGAGVGATTRNIVPRLKGYNVQYHFTDVSNFFLNKAKEEYKEYPFMKYSLYDINKDYTEQNLEAYSYDIVICANVLHNSKNAPEVLEKLCELLVDKGALLIIDATLESYSLLTSLELKGGLLGFTDIRAEKDQTFFLRDQWKLMLKDAGLQTAYIYPPESDPIVISGQGVFINFVDHSSEKNSIDQIKDFASKSLPQYMVPTHIEVIKNMPLNSNGKIDKKKLLASHVSVAKEEHATNEKMQNNLEMQIAEIWKDILNVDSIGRNDNFYVVGGDSLLIAQVVTKMKDKIKETKKWNWDSLMREILKNPTIADISAILQKDQNSENEQSDEKKDNKEPSLVVYKKSEKKGATVKAFFHAGTGRLRDYNYLIPRLVQENNDKTIIGFTYGDEKKYTSIPEENLIIDLAQKYADILSGFEAESYELVGYCVGGFIAMETARILMDSGKNIAPVVTISSHLCLHKIDNELLMELAYGSIIGSDMSKVGYSKDMHLLKPALEHILQGTNRPISTEELCELSGKYKELGKSFKFLSGITHEERMRKMYDSIEAYDFNGDESSISMLNILYEVFDHTYKGMINYEPEVFAGDVIVLSPIEHSETFYPQMSEDIDWNNMVVGGVKTEKIKGSHSSCLNEEYIQDILQYIN